MDPVNKDNQVPAPSGEELLRGSKAPVASNVPAEPKATPAPAPENTPPAAEPKANVPSEKSVAEIEAEVNAFLGGITPKADRPRFDSAPTDLKSKDGKSLQELVDDGRVAEAIQLGSSIAAKAERERVMAELGQAQVQKDFQSKRMEVNRRVYLAHPELLEVDKGTKSAKDIPFATSIGQVYQEYPNLLETAEGPLMAMEIAEKRLGIQKGNDRAQAQGKSEGAEAEKARQDAARASAALASSSHSAPPPAANEVALSSDEKIVAGKLGLTEQEYGTKKGRQPVFNAGYYAKYRGGPKPKR